MESRLLEVEMTNSGEVRTFVDYVQPATIFNCISYGAYSFETESNQIYETNFLSLVKLIESQLPGIMGSILLLNPDGIHLRCGAAPSLGPRCCGPGT